MLVPNRTLVLRLVFLLGVMFAWTFLPAAQTPPAPAWKWYKGNLHTHTINSDGDSSPDAVARWYKEHRYNFLVLTDHNFMTDPQGLNSIFAAEDRFLLVSGEEVSGRFDEKPIHVNGFNIRHSVAPLSGAGVVETIQKNVDAIRGAGGMPSLNHPNYRWAVSPEELSRVQGLKLFEVYNGHPRTNDTGGGGFPDLDKMWDVVLSAGREVYGVAVDDAHYFKVFGPEYSNPGRGWVSVQATELSTEAVVEALDEGRFYASTGVVLEEVTRLPNGLRIKIEEDGEAKFRTEFIGRNGAVLGTSADTTAEYSLKPADRYVRAKVTSSNGWQAWVQPVFAAGGGTH